MLFGLLGFNASATARVLSRRWNDDDEISFLVEETEVPGGNHRPTASNWWNFSHIRPLPSPGIELGPMLNVKCPMLKGLHRVPKGDPDPGPPPPPRPRFMQLKSPPGGGGVRGCKTSYIFFGGGPGNLETPLATPLRYTYMHVCMLASRTT